MSRPPAPVALAAASTFVALLAACGTPPELRDPPAGGAPSTGSPAPLTPSPTTPAAPTPPTPDPPATPTFGELTAVDCAGRPGGAQVVALLRRTTELLPAGARVTVRKAPVCAGDWQYTELRVPEREPLQVVTRGAPAALTLVAAGTDVCGIPVRTAAPPGIRAVACDAGPPPAVTGT